jgi:hypothetical protein
MDALKLTPAQHFKGQQLFGSLKNAQGLYSRTALQDPNDPSLAGLKDQIEKAQEDYDSFINSLNPASGTAPVMSPGDQLTQPQTPGVGPYPFGPLAPDIQGGQNNNLSPLMSPGDAGSPAIATPEPMKIGKYTVTPLNQ